MSAIKYILLFILTIGVLAVFLLRSHMPTAIKNMFAAETIISSVTADGELKSTDGRTNILLLGVDSRSAGAAGGTSLTDTIMVVSIDKDGTRPVMVSIPRDLWITETKSKINAVYPLSGKDVEVTKKAVESVVGIPIHYYAVVGFDAFKDAIKAVDGIEVEVDEAFDDYEYPIEGKENDPVMANRYEHLHFDAGRQKMDGETALKYARSRHSTNSGEGGDFARARRQQKVIIALKDKMLSAQTLFNPIKITELYNSYKQHVDTDIGLADALLFYTKYKDVKLGEVTKVVLSNEPTDEKILGSGTLTAPSEDERKDLYNGQYVLAPVSRSFDQIKSIVREAFFKD